MMTVTDFLTGPIPLTAFTSRPWLGQFRLEGEPEMVNAIVRDLRWQVTVIFEGEYPAADGIGKEIIYREEL